MSSSSILFLGDVLGDRSTCSATGPSLGVLGIGSDSVVTGPNEIFGGAWIYTKEVAVAPIALHLPPVVLVRDELANDTLTKDGYWLEALVPSDALVAGASIRLDSVSADHLN